MPPVVQPSGPSRVIAIEHESIQISFEILNAHPSVELSDITWSFNDKTVLNNLMDLNEAILSFSSDIRNLTISNVTYGIQGLYYFSAFNVAGRGSNFLNMTVEGK